MNFHIYCPSYKRIRSCISHKLFEPEIFSYVVRKEEHAAYAAAHPQLNFISIPKGKVSNIANTRNWILDNAKHPIVVMVDDDLDGIIWCINRVKEKLAPKQVTEQILNLARLAKEANAGLFGMNPLDDPMAYSIVKPFTFSHPILGPFMGVVDKTLRFDESLPLKEDYDFFIQQFQKHGLVMRSNFLMYSCDHQKMAGGCQELRTPEKEKQQLTALKSKWGSIIKDPRDRINPINPLVRVK